MCRLILLNQNLTNFARIISRTRVRWSICKSLSSSLLREILKNPIIFNLYRAAKIFFCYFFNLVKAYHEILLQLIDFIFMHGLDFRLQAGFFEGSECPRKHFVERNVYRLLLCTLPNRNAGDMVEKWLSTYWQNSESANTSSCLSIYIHSTWAWKS